MKLKYLAPLLLLSFLPQKSKGQFKAEVNLNTLDIKSEYFDINARSEYGLENYLDIKGETKLKFKGNGVYFSRDDLVNYTYGGNLDIKYLELYYNKSNQNTTTRNTKTENFPIGDITTETTLLDENKSEGYGIGLKYKGFFARYENAKKESDVDGSTLVTIGKNQNLVPFSLNYESESTIYSIGFRNGFFKFIQNEQYMREEENKNNFENFLINANYSFLGNEGDRANIHIYYGEGFSGFFNYNLFENVDIINKIDINLSYDYEKGFEVNLSSPDYSDLNQRDFERDLENRLRAVPRIYDFNLETKRKYLQDMFFTEPFSYDFSIYRDEINASLNLKNVLINYSEGSIKAGLKYKFAIGTYDFDKKELFFGVFFDGKK